MDGQQSGINQSLQFKLSIWLSTMIVLVGLATCFYTFFSAFQRTNEWQDNQLRQIAALLGPSDLPAQPHAKMTIRYNSDPESRIIAHRIVPASPLQIPKNDAPTFLRHYPTVSRLSLKIMSNGGYMQQRLPVESGLL